MHTPPETPRPSGSAPSEGPICLLVNPKSGRNSRDRAAIEAAGEVLGAQAHICEWKPDRPLRESIRSDASLVVSAGGDGTTCAVASEMLGTGIPMAVLPLGTFNFFARGLGYSEEPEEAARQILEGQARDIRIGTVNGQPFLNNASLGIYPTILRERESVYKRWGRRRIAAHWSVLRTFLKFKRPWEVTIDLGDGPRKRRTALIFVGRSAYQLERFGLKGVKAISDDKFAVLVAKAETRWDLFKLTARLTLRRIEEGRDYDFYQVPRMTLEVHKRRRVLIAYDGEKRWEEGPISFEMSRAPLRIVLPQAHEAT
ncbi:hypothetical protein OG2516_11216 [Oceanicola granulosus HTCC2516]|uniref:DAGKc domain-containing protein n=1 Tax=Oceanicola granulosus (strain ATCC BAA-861 / DSM 15982 / KCTC 12143 / HTCC2516) TaxID=314256 RepID=Q2CJW0_OCEGH|nr:diacylglycerol kinase family protein [Oceanicola granulosus]EAR53029.1 hypothetical protein OG2516_11216 [Oceanicola granulosus HTCC2516]